MTTNFENISLTVIYRDDELTLENENLKEWLYEEHGYDDLDEYTADCCVWSDYHNCFIDTASSYTVEIIDYRGDTIDYASYYTIDSDCIYDRIDAGSYAGCWAKLDDTIKTEDTDEVFLATEAYDECYRCEDCGEWFRSDAYMTWYCGNLYCEQCTDANGYGDTVIYPYHSWDGDYIETFTDAPKTGENRFPMGFELEVDNTKDTNEIIAETALNELNSESDFFHCEADASVEFEFISQPMTLAVHREQEAHYRKTLAYLDTVSESHDAKTCGLHVHVNRYRFKDSDEAVSRVVAIMEYFNEEMFTFSRRQSREYKYAHFGVQLEKSTLKKEKVDFYDDWGRKDYCKNYNGHNTYLNLFSGRTIEFRLFRGTLKYETLVASLELVQNICMIANDSSIRRVAWSDLLKGQYCEAYASARRIECTAVLDFDFYETPSHVECDGISLVAAEI